MKRSSVASSGGASTNKNAKLATKVFERPGLSEDEVAEIKEAFDMFDP